MTIEEEPEVVWLNGLPVAMLGALSPDTRIRWDDLDADAPAGDFQTGPPEMDQPVVVIAWADGSTPTPPPEAGTVATSRTKSLSFRIEQADR